MWHRILEVHKCRPSLEDYRFLLLVFIITPKLEEFSAFLDTTPYFDSVGNVLECDPDVVACPGQ